MNPTKIKYAVERARRIRDRKLVAVKTGELFEMTPKMKLKALKEGAFTLKKEPDRYSDYLSSYVEFNAMAGNESIRKKAEAEKEAINTAYETLKEELYLGDEAEALALLRAFDAS